MSKKYPEISCMMQLRTCHVFDVKHNASVTAATSLMTQFEKVHRSQTSIEVSWRKFLFAPQLISVNFMCRHIINDTLYLDKTLFLHPNETSFMLQGILPATECCFVLKAVYNPASIDNGIRTTCKTLPYSKRIMLYSFGVGCTLDGVLITVNYAGNCFIFFY